MCASSPAFSRYAELAASGLSRRAITGQVARGELSQVRTGVYARPGACAEGLTAAHHGGALACISAARHRGLFVLEADHPVHVWLRPHGRSRPHDGCTCVPHWDSDSATAFGEPTIPQILRQILACRGVESFFVTLESALRQGMLTRAEIAWLRTRTNDAGRDAIAFARRDADSGVESLLRWRLRRHRIRLRSQVRIISVGVVDFLIGERLIVEVDGKGNHEGATERHRDLVRDANAAAWGYVTLRFDYAQVVHDWESVELAILAHLDRGLHHG